MSDTETAAKILAARSERADLVTRIKGLEQDIAAVQARLTQTLPWDVYQNATNTLSRLRRAKHSIDAALAQVNQRIRELHAVLASEKEARRSETCYPDLIKIRARCLDTANDISKSAETRVFALDTATQISALLSAVAWA